MIVLQQGIGALLKHLTVPAAHRVGLLVALPHRHEAVVVIVAEIEIQVGGGREQQQRRQ